MLQLHGDAACIEADVVTDDPGVYQSRLNFLRDLFERRALRNVLITDAVYPLCVGWAGSSRIDQVAEVAVPRELFAAILERIQRFGMPPPLLQRG